MRKIYHAVSSCIRKQETGSLNDVLMPERIKTCSTNVARTLHTRQTLWGVHVIYRHLVYPSRRQSCQPTCLLSPIYDPSLPLWSPDCPEQISLYSSSMYTKLFVGIRQAIWCALCWREIGSFWVIHHWRHCTPFLIYSTWYIIQRCSITLHAQCCIPIDSARLLSQTLNYIEHLLSQRVCS